MPLPTCIRCQNAIAIEALCLGCYNSNNATIIEYADTISKALTLLTDSQSAAAATLLSGVLRRLGGGPERERNNQPPPLRKEE